jgi:hypothetical protein
MLIDVIGAGVLRQRFTYAELPGNEFALLPERDKTVLNVVELV